eukprot:scaffold72126_cov71-Phaeocystis_antarctica.AAC.7
MRQLVSRRAERAGAAPGCMCGRRVVVTGSCVRLRGGGGWLAGAARACGARGVSTARGALAPAAVCGRLLGRAPRAALLVRRVVQAQLLRRGARLAGGGVEAPHLGAALCSRSACLPARTARRRGWQSATSPIDLFYKIHHLAALAPARALVLARGAQALAQARAQALARARARARARAESTGDTPAEADPNFETPARRRCQYCRYRWLARRRVISRETTWVVGLRIVCTASDRVGAPRRRKAGEDHKLALRVRRIRPPDDLSCAVHAGVLRVSRGVMTLPKEAVILVVERHEAVLTDGVQRTGAGAVVHMQQVLVPQAHAWQEAAYQLPEHRLLFLLVGSVHAYDLWQHSWVDARRTHLFHARDAISEAPPQHGIVLHDDAQILRATPCAAILPRPRRRSGKPCPAAAGRAAGSPLAD